MSGVRVDGIMYELTENIKLEKNKKHTIEVVVEPPDYQGGDPLPPVQDSIETASALTGGLALVDVIGGEEILFSQNYSCPDQEYFH